MSRYWDIYEQELYVLGHGLPIWEAEPFAVRDEVQIGDVGYMHEGRFRRVFNAFYDDTSSSHDQVVPRRPLLPPHLFVPASYEQPYPNVYGVPSGHVPLTMPTREFGLHGHISMGAHSGEHCQLKVVSPRASVEPAALIPVEVGMSLSFTSERQRGAALFLRSDGERWEAPVALFKNYSNPLWEHWREFTRDCMAHSDGADKLMFVYGHTKTTAWTSVAIEQRRSTRAVSLDVEVPAIGSTGLEFRQSEMLTRSPHINHGPWHLEGGGAEPRELKRNQTVFIRRLMASDRSSLDKLLYKMAYRIVHRDGSLGGPVVDKSTKTWAGQVRLRALSETAVRPTQHSTSTEHSVRRASRYLATIEQLTNLDKSTSFPERSFLDEDAFHLDPLEILSFYIFENEPDANHVMVSDDDVDDLFQTLKTLHITLPENMEKLLHQLRPNTYTDLAGFGHLGALSTTIVQRLGEILRVIRARLAESKDDSTHSVSALNTQAGVTLQQKPRLLDVVEKLWYAGKWGNGTQWKPTLADNTRGVRAQKR